MSTAQESTQLTWAWAQQRIWSLTANRLKRGIDRARLAALALGIATAVLAVVAHQVGGLSVLAGQVLSAAAAVTAGAATLVQRRVSSGQIRDWTRARSASEGLKTEIYGYLGGGAAYTGPDPGQRLGENTSGIVEAVSDLQRHTLGVVPDSKPIPPVHDVDSYIALRVNDQIGNYYQKKAALYDKRVRRLRGAGDVLGVTALVLAAVAAAFKVDSLNAWVPVVTTIGTSVAAYIAAARYDHMVIEFLRTAQRLESLCRERRDKPDGDPAAFIDACEAAISVENQGWMARWDAPDQDT
jgi:SMODS and SLOG-associating 2TM effector domain 1/Protein of unknown function (DUF4231)